MENELKTNAVKLSPEEQYQIRKSIVRLSKKGKTNGEIAEILDVSKGTSGQLRSNTLKEVCLR